MEIIEGKTFDIAKQHTGLALTGSGVIVRNCVFRGSIATNFAIDIQGAKRVRIENCLFSDILSAIQISSGDDITIANNVVTNWRLYGVVVRAGQRITVASNRFSNPWLGDKPKARQMVCAYGLQPEKVRWLQVVGNHCEGTSQPWPIGTGDQIAIIGASDFVVADNYSINGGENGISVSSATRGIIRGNIVYGNDGHGIQVGAQKYPSSGVLVTGNHCSGNGRVRDGKKNTMAGIYLQEANHCGITGNFIHDEETGIHIAVCDNVAYEANTIFAKKPMAVYQSTNVREAA